MLRKYLANKLHTMAAVAAALAEGAREVATILAEVADVIQDHAQANALHLVDGKGGPLCGASYRVTYSQPEFLRSVSRCHRCEQRLES